MTHHIHEEARKLKIRFPPSDPRYSFVVLVIIALLLTGATIIININQINSNDHKFCQLITASLAGQPVPKKPADPTKDPSRERLYENYQIVKNLGKSLGCL